MAPKRARQRVTPQIPDKEPDSSAPSSPIQHHLRLNFGESDEVEAHLPSVAKATEEWTAYSVAPTATNTLGPLESLSLTFGVPLLQAVFNAVLYTVLESWNGQTRLEGQIDTSEILWPWFITRLLLPGWLALGYGLDGMSPSVLYASI
jgi:hypothetical protein